MKSKFTTLALAVACAASLAACGNAGSVTSDGSDADSGAATSALTSDVGSLSTGSALTATVTEKASGMGISADHATVTDPELLGSLTIEEGDSLAYVSRLTEGTVHLTVSSDVGEVMSERELELNAFVTDILEPGTYEVRATAQGATGTIYLAAADENEISQQISELVGQETAEAIYAATPTDESATSSSADAATPTDSASASE